MQSLETCCVCLSEYDTETCIPVVLPCGHSICSGCSQMICRSDRRSARCPTCREPLGKIPRSGFPKNWTCLAMLRQGAAGAAAQGPAAGAAAAGAAPQGYSAAAAVSAAAQGPAAGAEAAGAAAQVPTAAAAAAGAAPQGPAAGAEAAGATAQVPTAAAAAADAAPQGPAVGSAISAAATQGNPPGQGSLPEAPSAPVAVPAGAAPAAPAAAAPAAAAPTLAAQSSSTAATETSGVEGDSEEQEWPQSVLQGRMRPARSAGQAAPPPAPQPAAPQGRHSRVHQMLVVTQPPPGAPPQQRSVELDVPQNQRGRLCGPKHTLRIELESHFNVEINVPHYGCDQHVTICGADDDVAQTLEAYAQKGIPVYDYVVDKRQKRGRGGRRRPQKRFVQLDVPAHCRGQLIGVGGATINRLRQQYCVDIDVPGRHDVGPVEIRGHSDGVEGALAEAQSRLRCPAPVVYDQYY